MPVQRRGRCRVAATFRPDVVLLDIGLPRMNGYDVARQLRRLLGMDTTLLVAITGCGQEADVQRCKQAGIDRHFLKPVDPDELKQLLATAEKRRTAAMALNLSA